MRASAPGGARIEDPGSGIEIQCETVAMAVDNRPGLGETSAQQVMAVARRRLMTVNDDQRTARQPLLQPFGQMNQKASILFRPLACDIIVAEHCQDPPQARLELGQDGGTADVATVNGQVAAADHLLDTRIQGAMGVGQDRDTNQVHAHCQARGGCVRVQPVSPW